MEQSIKVQFRKEELIRSVKTESIRKSSNIN